MTDTDAELTYGDLDLLGNDSPFHALAGGTFGSAERVVEAFAKLLFDGEDARLRRRGNRTLTFQIEVTGDDLLAVAEAAALLEVEADKARNALRWKPPGMNTPVSVFRTFPAVELRHEFDDLDELRSRRVYTLSIPASPSAYSEDAVTVDVPAGGSPVFTLVDAMDSLTGWSGGSGVSLSVVGGAAIEATTSSSTVLDRYWQANGPSRTVTDYVTVDASPSIQAMTLVAAGVSFPAIGSERVAGVRRFWFKPGAGTKTLGIRWRSVWGHSGYEFAEINTTTTPPEGLPRMVAVLGSAPSEVSVRVALGGSSVCLVAGGPMLQHYKPLMAETTLTGASPQFGGPGGGAYAIVGHVDGPTSPASNYTVTGSDGQAVVSQVPFGWSVQSLGTFFVPPGRGGAPSEYTVDFEVIDGTAWALPIDDDHAFAIFTDLTADYLFLEPPTLDNPEGGAWEGDSPDGSDAVPVLSKASRFQLPKLSPAETPLYVYPEDAALQLVYTPAWGLDAAL